MSAVALPALPTAAPSSPPGSPAPKAGEPGSFAKALQQAGGRPKEAAKDGAAAQAPDAPNEVADDPGAEERTQAGTAADAAAAAAMDGSRPLAATPRPDPGPDLVWLAGAQTGAGPEGDSAAFDGTAGAGAIDLAGMLPATAGADPAVAGRRAPSTGLSGGPSDADTTLPWQTALEAAPGTAAAGADNARLLPAALAAAATGGLAGAAAPGAAASPEGARLAPPLHSPGFAPALGAQLTLMVRDGLSEARLHLNPAEMGPLSVRISIDGANARVDLVADHAQTRQVLEQAMPVLAGALRDSGLTLTGGGVFEQPRDARQPGGDSAPRPRAPGTGDGDTAAGADVGAAPVAGDPLRSGGRARGVVDLYA